MFKNARDDMVDIKEIPSDIREIVHIEWKYWKGMNSRRNWSDFKTYWDLDNNLNIFEEISKLSIDMLQEWRSKYGNFYPYTDKKFKNKSKKELWVEFKEMWELDFNNYNEDKYKTLVEDLDDEQRKMSQFEQNAWDEWVSENYNSYDEQCILYKYEIWEEFVKKL